jgi:hypothetical protein
VEFSRERLASSINKGGKGNKDTQREKKSFFSALLSQPHFQQDACLMATLRISLAAACLVSEEMDYL